MSEQIVQLNDAQGNWLYPRSSSFYAPILDINGDAQTVAQWCFNHYRTAEIHAARINHSDYVEPFKYAAFTILYCLSSTNYGWIAAFSDSSGNPMAFAQIIAGTVYGWYKVYSGNIDKQKVFTAYGKNWTFRKHQGVVYLEAPADAYGVAAGWQDIGTLDADMRPHDYVRLGPQNTNSYYMLQISPTTGRVELYSEKAISSPSNFAFHACYLAASGS